MFVVSVWGEQYREELIRNNIALFARFWVLQYRGELMLIVTVFVVSVWGEQYREELILNVTALFAMF